jgi:hypothetical protein
LTTTSTRRRGHRPHAVLDDVESSFTAYLAAEKESGRVFAESDPATCAFILLGAIHHIFMTNTAGSLDLKARLGQIVASLLPRASLEGRQEPPGPRTADAR